MGRATLEGKVRGINVETTPIFENNQVMGPGYREWVSGSSTVSGIRVLENGQEKDTIFYFRGPMNVKYGDQVKVIYEMQGKKHIARDVEVIVDGKAVEKYSIIDKS